MLFFSLGVIGRRWSATVSIPDFFYTILAIIVAEQLYVVCAFNPDIIIRWSSALCMLEMEIDFWNHWVLQETVDCNLSQCEYNYDSMTGSLPPSFTSLSLSVFLAREVPNVICITKTRLFKYIENLTSKNWKFSDKKLWYFSYCGSKYRLWVLVRTASARRF